MTLQKNVTRRCAFVLGLLALVFSWTDGPPSSVAAELDADKQFTIEALEPDLKKQHVQVTFSTACDHKALRKQVKIYPPVGHWISRRDVRGHELRIRGTFKAGQRYTVTLADAVDCNGRKYVPTLQTFQMPEWDPLIKLAEKGSIIERDSRQMLHVTVRNVDELVFEGRRIAPVQLLAALKLVKQKTPPDQWNEALEATPAPPWQAVAPPVAGRERQLFFPGGPRNQQQTFSMPLTFRRDKAQGGIMLAALSGRDQQRPVTGPVQLLRITDLALTYKISAHKLLVWVTSLRTGLPVARVALYALTRNDQAVVLGRSDRDGLVVLTAGQRLPHYRLTAEGALEEKPLNLNRVRFLVAETTQDSTYLAVRPRGNLRPDWITQARPTRHSSGRLFKGHLFTERGIYRPGEIVHFKGTLRELKDREILPPTDITPTVIIKNAKNETVYEQQPTVSEFGTLGDSIRIKPYFPLGTYTLQMKHDVKDKQPLASRTFQVQAFRPPRHFAEVHFTRDRRPAVEYVNRSEQLDLLNCDILGRYYAGGPVKHGKVRWKAYYTGTDFRLADYPDFVFGNYMASRSRLLESGESILDEQGNLKVSLPAGNQIVAGVYGMEVIATVVDFDGRAAARSAVYQHRPGYLVGISRHDARINAGEAQVLKLIVVDAKGRTVKKGDLEVVVMKKDWTYIRKRNQAGDLFWDWQEVWHKQVTTALAIEKGRALFDFDFVRGGDYLLKFIYRRKGHDYQSSTRFTVTGAYYGYEYANRNRGFEKLALLPDKKEYAPGETMRLYINPHRPLARVLLTLEQNRILTHRVIDLKPEQKYIDIPITTAHIPNIYVSVFGTAGRQRFPVYTGQVDTEAPTFLFGVTNITVKNVVDRLQLTIGEESRPLKARPGEEVALALQVTDKNGAPVKSEIALGVVDESVLALTGYQTPTLDALTRFLSPLAVFTGDLRAELLRQTPFDMIANEPVTGGGGLKKKPEAVTSRVRTDFRPVAYFNPQLRTDDTGRVTVRFLLPDTMTTYRVYAVACDTGSQFASKQRDLLAVKEFYLEPGLPRFLTRDDRFEFAVAAFNKTDRSGPVRLAVDHDPRLELTVAPGPFNLRAFERTLVPVKGRAVTPGPTALAVRGRFGEREDTVQLKLPINSGHLFTTDILYGTFGKKTELTYRFPPGTAKIPWAELNPDDVQVLLTLSGSPFLKMGGGLNYLLRYPYGCIEQTSSGVMPLAALRDLIRQGFIAHLSLEKTDKFLTKGVARLLSMQTDDGGFGYWPGNLRPHRWGSIYALTALTQARAAGMDVPAQALDRALAYLKRILSEKPGTDDQKADTLKAYAIYLLAHHQRLTKAQFRKLYNRLDKLAREAALLVLWSGWKSNLLTDMPALQAKARAWLTRQPERNRGVAFSARYREPAIALLTATALLPDDPFTGRQAKRLMDGIGRNGIWSSTSDTGWSLMALGRYFTGQPFAGKPAEIHVEQAGQPARTVRLAPRGHETMAIDPGTFIQQPRLTLSRPGAGQMVYMLSLRFPRVDWAATGYANGFTIHKTVTNTDGSPAIKVGDVVKVKLLIDIGDRNDFIVLDDPLPAGLVAINSAIKTEEAVGPQARHSAWSDWDPDSGTYRFVPNYFEIRDDRVLAFKNRAWRGTYHYEYFARAVISGEFVLPSTKVQLMYAPDVVSFTPQSKVVIAPR